MKNIISPAIITVVGALLYLIGLAMSAHGTSTALAALCSFTGALLVLVGAILFTVRLIQGIAEL